MEGVTLEKADCQQEFSAGVQQEFSAVPANLHRWHMHIDKVDVKMNALFYKKALQTHAASPVRAGVGKAHLSPSRLG